jgi:predicted nuclease of predicted toxin-antitoxin system
MAPILKIVTDECVDYEVTIQLRNAGFEVLAICEISPSVSDKSVLEIAFQNNSLLITEDKDFGELVIRMKLPNCGILLIRMQNESSQMKAESAVNVILKYNEELLQAFSVLETNRFRIRPIMKENFK